MIRIYLIVTLCLFTFLACDQEAERRRRQELLETMEELRNRPDPRKYAVGSYLLKEGATYYIGTEECTVNTLDIYEVPSTLKTGYKFWARWNGSSAEGTGSWRSQSDCDISFDLEDQELRQSLEGKWESNNGWYIVVPDGGFSKDLSSIVLGYSGQEYPFKKVK